MDYVRSLVLLSLAGMFLARVAMAWAARKVFARPRR